VRLLRQLLSLHRHVHRAVLHGRQGGREGRRELPPARRPLRLLPMHQSLLRVPRARQGARGEEDRRVTARRLLRAPVLHVVCAVPGGDGGQRARPVHG
jgi:hypothetical protein